MTCERLAGLRSLDGAEAAKLVRLDVDLATETDTTGRTADEADTVRVQTLVDGRRTGLGASERDTTSLDRLLPLCFQMTFSEVPDNSRLHEELDPVEGDEPDDVPHPDDANPATRDSLDVGEAPVSVRSDDRRDDLRNDEGEHQGNGRPLHEAESVRTRNEDERLRNDSDLQVDNGVKFLVVVVNTASLKLSVERDVELVLEEVCLDDDNNKNNPVTKKYQHVVSET